MIDGVYTILRQQSPLSAEVPRFSQPGFFFNDAEHACQQSTRPFHVITALNQTTGLADARCAFFSEPDCAVSPAAAPFGSVEFVQTLPDSVLSNVVDALIDEARRTGAPVLRLVNYPHCYAPEQTHRLTECLLDRGFSITATNHTAFLPVTGNPFADTIVASERRRLEKCRRAGFRFAHWCCPDIDAVVSFVAKTRRQQGYRLTLPSDRLTNLLRAFPDQFPVFVIRDGPAVVALTVAVRVRTDILYNFLPASDPDYHAYSPMVMLVDGLFGYCQHQRIQLLDLGASLDGNRQPKPGLMRFKRNLGAQESPKLTFEKRFFKQGDTEDSQRARSFFI